VVAADTYLHLSTKSVLFTDATPRTEAPYFGANMKLSTPCQGNNTFFAQAETPCIIQYQPVFNATSFLPGTYGASILANDSTSIAVYTFTPPAENDTTASPTSFAYVASGLLSPVADYVAQTFAVSTRCKIVTPDCTSDAESSSTVASYDCEPKYPAFKFANMTAGSNEFYFFSSPEATSEDVFNGSDPSRANQNAFTMGIASSTISTLSFLNFGGAVEDYYYFSNTYLFFLLCEISTWEAQYTYFNNSVVADSWLVTPANSSVSNMVQSGIAFVNVGYDRLASLINSAFSDMTKNFPDDAAVTSFSSGVSSLVLSIAAAGMTKADPISEQWRASWVVSKLQRSAVWTLIATNMALALLGGLLFLIAVAILVSGGNDICEILRRLSVNGVVFQAAQYSPDLGLRKTSGNLGTSHSVNEGSTAG
jgi:hypothetical protein